MFIPRIYGATLALAGYILVLAFGALVPEQALAQSCSRLNNTVRSLERNRDFRNLNANIQTARDLSRGLNSVERAFVQAGCQRALNNGQNLNRQCRTAARNILRGRRDLGVLEERIRTGQEISRQRARLLQQINSGNCGSRATVQTNTRPRNFFEQLFDSLSGNTVVQDEFQGYQNFNTLRSVCVRKSDGYYWPVSFSTVADYLQNDAIACQAQCPGTEVDLYYYSNPGQEPKDMVNLSGQAYTALPTAFQYRQEYNLENSCKARVESGKIEIVEENGVSRAILSIGDVSLPLPLRDPRHVFETVVAEAIHVPLPRPRPRAPGEEGDEPVEILSADLRLIEMNGKVIRIVGPDTPYARSGATGT